MGNASKLLFLLTSTTPSPFLLHHCPSLLRLARRRHRLAFQRCLSSLSAQYHHHHLPISHSLRHHPLKLKSSRVCIHTAPCGSHSSFASPPDVSQPWPEWTNFLQNLSACGYFNSRPFADGNDDFVSGSDFPEDFVRAASACLAFSRQRPDVLGMLSRKDVDAVVENLTPFIFKNGDDSVRRMELLLNGCNVNELNAGGGCMVDLMKFLLSYISNFVSSKNNSVRSGELVESSVRNLLSELSRHSFNASESNLSEPALNQFPDGHGQTHRPLGQYGEMRRGDWICPRCSFMNFARNARCLDCDETRPKRQLTGGEWECPQCDFFNYGKNMVCLRCDCKRPGEVSIQTANARSDLGYGSESYPYNSDVDSRLAANEEKAQRWFKKVSQLDGAMDKSSAAADEDFPEIMPLRKGVNRFVVSTKKSPLERGRLSNSQYQKSMNIDGNVEPDIIQSTVANQNQTTEILGFQSDATEFDKRFLGNEQNGGTNSAASVSNTASPQHGNLQGGNSKRAPFVPLPADMFAKKPDDSKVNESGKVETDNYKLSASTNGERTRYASEGSGGNLKESWQTSQKPEDHSPSNNKEREQEEKSERWFKRVAELHNVTDLSSVIPDEDFPEIMPLREGENRFVVSKKKDRSLTSPKYKRQMAIEQENSTNFVPFVPFPPDYFAKKGNHQSEEANEASKSTGEKPRKMSDDSTHTVTEASKGQGMENQEHSTTDPNLRHRGQSSNESNSVIAEGKPGSGNSMPTSINPQPSGRYSWSNEDTRKQTISRTPNVRSNSQQGLVSTGSSPKENSLSGIPSENQNFRDGWSGKSLEGSAVKEPDPLDMSEEAKAERWFRRAAQIKDISELSQIPDEDFPEIMPMRKGVNRFVVSKRKTPLERRLTSAQYRKNLPIVSSDPVKRSDS